MVEAENSSILDTRRCSERRDVFLQRSCHDPKPGGRVAAVLPDKVLIDVSGCQKRRAAPLRTTKPGARMADAVLFTDEVSTQLDVERERAHVTAQSGDAATSRIRERWRVERTALEERVDARPCREEGADRGE